MGQGEPPDDGGEFSAASADRARITTGAWTLATRARRSIRWEETRRMIPFMSAISAAYLAGINEYVRADLHYGENMTYKPSARGTPTSSGICRHRLPGSGLAGRQRERDDRPVGDDEEESADESAADGRILRPGSLTSGQRTR